jgi:hypothetical protein
MKLAQSKRTQDGRDRLGAFPFDLSLEKQKERLGNTGRRRVQRTLRIIAGIQNIPITTSDRDPNMTRGYNPDKRRKTAVRSF